MEFNYFVYVLVIFFGGTAIAMHLLERRLRISHFRMGYNAEFLFFQRSFLAGYLPCLFADSLQAPFLYYLYQSYGFLESQIAILYVGGHITSVICTITASYFTQFFERRMVCLFFVAINSLSCLLKFANSYFILFVSRILDGVASSLLGTAFQDWYIHEHTESNDFPTEWIPLTFRQAALFGAYLAIGAGFAAELSETAAVNVTAFPFLLAVPFLLLGGFWIVRFWHENRLEASKRTRFWPQLGKAMKSIARQPTAFLFSAVQSLYESVIYLFVFLWTPLFMTLKSEIKVRPALGIIYSCFMCSVLTGTVLHRVLSRKLSAVNMLPLAVALSFVSMSIVVILTYPGPVSSLKYKILVVAFCTYELGVGLYFPIMQRLQKELLPVEQRSTILGLFRLPLTVLACVGLLLLHGRDSQHGNWLLLIMSMVFLALCLMACLLLQGVQKNQTVDLNNFALQLRPGESDED